MDLTDNVRGGRLVHPPVANVIGQSTIQVTPQSSLTLAQGLLPCADSEFEALWAAKPAPTPNPFDPDGPEIVRRQGTYGKEYRFGAQLSRCLGPIDEAPEVVRRAVMMARAEAQKLGIDPDLATVAHTNWYEVGPKRVASLGFHQDVDPAGKGLPVMSFTLMSTPPGVAPYRYFVIANDSKGKQKELAVPLRHGDYLCMLGEFQQEKYHGVPPLQRKDHVGQRRINITVRFWG